MIGRPPALLAAWTRARGRRHPTTVPGPGCAGRRAARVAVAAVLLLVLAGSAAAGPLAVVAHRALIGPAYHRDGLLTFLVIGSDIGPPHRPGNPLRGRGDALHLVAVDPRSYRATIVDFPRDSLIAGRKVTEHLYRGGPEHVRGVLQDYTGIPIDFWALTTFRGLENLVTGMGGIDVVVDQPMRDPFSGSNFAPGPQRLNGGQALAYVRDRHSVRGGDFGRTRHQGDLLRFAHIQIRTHLWHPGTLARLVTLFSRNTVSNIPPGELLMLGVLATQIDPANVLQVPLSGGVGMQGSASVVFLAPGSTFERIRAGQVGP